MCKYRWHNNFEAKRKPVDIFYFESSKFMTETIKLLNRFLVVQTTKISKKNIKIYIKFLYWALPRTCAEHKKRQKKMFTRILLFADWKLLSNFLCLTPFSQILLKLFKYSANQMIIWIVGIDDTWNQKSIFFCDFEWRI